MSKRAIFIVLAVIALAACGSSSKGSTTGANHQTDLGRLNQIGTYDGYQVHEFFPPGKDCIFVENTIDNNIALSCSSTLTTSTTTFGTGN